MNKKTAFTLIELLVVIAIMSMLAAFLLPALAKARAKAKYARWQTYSHTLEANPELVAYYNFQEGSGTTLYNRASGLDRRGYDQEALDGTTGGGANAHWTTTNGRWPGKGAIEFDGSNDYVNCGDDSSLNITDVITVEAWARFDILNPAARLYGRMVIKGSDYYFLSMATYSAGSPYIYGGGTPGNIGTSSTAYVFCGDTFVRKKK